MARKAEARAKTRGRKAKPEQRKQWGGHRRRGAPTARTRPLPPVDPTQITPISKTYDAEAADRIIELMISGESGNEACRQVGIPNGTFRIWIAQDIDKLRARYAAARDIGADSLVEQILDIADNQDNDIGIDGQGNHVQVSRDRLRIDARKWLAAKLAPHRYGEKVEITHQGGSNPLRQVTVSMTAQEAMEAYAEMVRETQRR